MTTVRSLLQRIIERAPFTDPDSRYACEKAAQDALELLDEPVGEVVELVEKLRNAHPSSAQYAAGSTILLDSADALDDLLAKVKALTLEVDQLKASGEQEPVEMKEVTQDDFDWLQNIRQAQLSGEGSGEGK